MLIEMAQQFLLPKDFTQLQLQHHNPMGGIAPMQSGSSGDSSSTALMNKIQLAQPINMLASRKSETGLSQSKMRTQTTTMKQKAGTRKSHSETELKYRKNLKRKFEELQAAIPALQSQQNGKSNQATDSIARTVSKVSYARKLSLVLTGKHHIWFSS